MSSRITFLILLSVPFTIIYVTDVDSASVQRCRQNNSDTKFINNGYEGLLVLVGEEVKEDYALINDLKNLLYALSDKMFQVTNRRAYIRKVNVLLPKSWGSPPKEFKGLLHVKPTNSVFSEDRSDFKLKHRSPRFEGDKVAWELGDEEAEIDVPYVIKPTPCGYSGQYLRITPEFVRFGQKAKEIIGTQEKLMLREWAKLRWGVYDEIPMDGANTNFYTHTDLSIRPTACSLAIEGEVINSEDPSKRCSLADALIDSVCEFEPNPKGRTLEGAKKSDGESIQGSYASIMYRPNLDYVDHFCDNNEATDEDIPVERQHNSEAPTIHNSQCQGKSIWEIMREHPDFTNGRNPPLPVDFIPPKIDFSLLQNPDRRIVLVLDVSTSMLRFNRLQLMRQAASQFIETVPENSWIGIVAFAVQANEMSELVEITSNDVRRHLKQRLPNVVVTGTSIGSGIKMGLKVLKTSGPENMRNSGGSMLVLSDGKEHNVPKINDTLQEVLDFGVKVTTIAFGGQVAEDLEILSEITGGSSYFASSGEFSDNSELRNAFLAAIDKDNDDVVVVSSKSVTIEKNSSAEHDFIIDTAIGEDTRITVLYTDSTPPEIGLRNPTGDEIWEGDEIGRSDLYAEFSIDKEFLTKTIQYFDIMQNGTWSLLLKNPMIRNRMDVDITVFSHPAEEEESVTLSPALLCRQINYTGSESIVIYAHVNLGEFAVLDAIVTAFVTRPLSSTGISDTAEVELKDDGRGADVIADDGIYSGYFTSFTLRGRYNVRVKAVNDGTARYDTDYILGLGRRRDEITTVDTKDVLKNWTDSRETEVASRKRRNIFKGGRLPKFTRDGPRPEKFVVSDTAADVCPEGYKHFQDSCYKDIRFPMMPAAEASEMCNKEGGYLAVVNSNQEYTYLLDTVKNRDTWIGGLHESLNKYDIPTQRRARRESKDEDLMKLTELFNVEYLSKQLRRAIESFEPDLEGLSRKDINNIIRQLKITSISQIENLKEEFLLAQQNLDDSSNASNARVRREVDNPPEGSGTTEVYLIPETTQKTFVENATLALAKKKPDQVDLESSAEVNPECSWLSDRQVYATFGDVCQRSKAFLCERSKNDLVAPSKIKDFRIMTTDDPQIVKFMWKATGDDHTVGRATRYEIRNLRTGRARTLQVKFELGDIVKREAIVNGTIDNPKMSGKAEEIVINLTSISGCPVHAAMDIILVLPRRLLDAKQALQTERNGAFEMLQTLLDSVKISTYEVQITLVAANARTGQIILQDSIDKNNIKTAYRRGVEVENNIADDGEADLLGIMGNLTTSGRQDVPKAVLSLLANDDMEIAQTLKNISDIVPVTIVAVGISDQRTIRAMVSEPKCENAIFPDGWRNDWNATIANVTKQICRARRDEYQVWGIVAFDEVNQGSEPSNIVTHVIRNNPEQIICPPEPTNAPLPVVAGINSATLGMAFGIPTAAILSIVGAVMLFGQVRKYRRKKQLAKEKAAREADEAAAEERRTEAMRNARARGVLQKLRINKTTPISQPPV